MVTPLSCMSKYSVTKGNIYPPDIGCATAVGIPVKAIAHKTLPRKTRSKFQDTRFNDSILSHPDRLLGMLCFFTGKLPAVLLFR
jgi:hypothetical protein